MKARRNLLIALAAAGLGWLAVRTARALAADVGRYNRIREMSGDGPISDELPEMARKIFASEAKTPGMILDALRSIPSEGARYLKIEAM